MPPRPTIEPLEPRTLLSTAPTPLRINAGGPALTDSLARPFSPDSGFTGGTPISTPYAVANTPDDALFSSYRTGPAFTFSRPVANGHYNLVLLFADPTSTAPGQRTFDVSAEGAFRLHDLDIFQEVAATYGPFPTGTALAKSFDVNVTDGQFDLAFTGVTGDAIVSALVLLPTDIPTAARPYTPVHGYYTPGTPLGDASNDHVNVLAASNLRQVGSYIQFYADGHKGNFPPDLKAVFTDASYLRMETFKSPRTDTLRPRGELSRVEEVAWVGNLNDFVYLAAGRTYRTTPADSPIAYENPDRVIGGINVLRADGSVQFYPRADAAALLGFPDAPPNHPPATQDPNDPALQADPRVIDSMWNLRNIGAAMYTYSTENRSNYPATPGLINGYDTTGGIPDHISPQTFVNPRGTTPAPPPDLTPEQGSAWIDASTDYVYLGAGKRSSAPADAVLAFENPAEMTAGLNFLMGDTGVEFREFRWALETIARAGATPRLPKPGDATRDGLVNFNDLLVLAKNYNTPDAPTFTRGDFNYDGTVNFDDLLILAQNYGRTSAPIAPAPSLATSAAKPQTADLLTRPPHPTTKPKSRPRTVVHR